MARTPKNDDCIYPAAEPRPLIPEGVYMAECTKAERGRYLGKEPKLYLHFNIIEGEHMGIALFEAMSFRRPAPLSSKFYAEWTTAMGRRPGRRDRMSPKDFEGRVYKVKVATAKPKYADKSEKPPVHRYSVVDHIVEPLTGTPCILNS